MVDAEEERRLARVQRRSGLPEREIRDRMARQMKSQEKRIRADFVIENYILYTAVAIGRRNP